MIRMWNWHLVGKGQGSSVKAESRQPRIILGLTWLSMSYWTIHTKEIYYRLSLESVSINLTPKGQQDSFISGSPLLLICFALKIPYFFIKEFKILKVFCAEFLVVFRK